MGGRASKRIGRVEVGARLAAAVLGGVLAVAPPLSAANLVVTTIADTIAADGGCSLREAIQAANGDLAVHECPAGSGPDRIRFALPAAATIALAAPLPTIVSALLVQGPGQADLVLDGQGAHQVLHYDGSAAGLEVRDLTIAEGGDALLFGGGGAEIEGGGVAVFRRVLFLANRAARGAGLYAESGSQVEIDACWFADNVASSLGGALFHNGSMVGSRLTIDRSTFSANRSGESGGAVWTAAPTTIARSTFSGNVADDDGGAVLLWSAVSPMEVTIRHSTLSGNTADALGQGGFAGGGIATIYVGGEMGLTLNNSIVAGNSDGGGQTSDYGPDIELSSGIQVTTLGHNLIGDNAVVLGALFPAGQPNANGDYVGDTATPLDPRLGPLQFLGGPTPTRRPTLSPLSPALDNGKCPSSTSDQRGHGDVVAHTRAVDLPAVANGPDSPAGCDIGAFERDGDEGSDPGLFADGFESGTGFAWSHERP